MKKIFLLFAVLFILSIAASAQETKSDDAKDDSVLMPIEVRGATPSGLEGRWVLVAGLKKVNRKPADFVDKSPSPKTNDDAAPSKITPEHKDKLHKPERPNISFFGQDKTFSGFTGCNKYAGRYTLNGHKLKLNNAAASTKMVCLGEYDEEAFLEKIKQVNSYKSSDGHLYLMDGGDVLLEFARK